MMRFVLVTYGSLGDTRPFIALGQGLQRLGNHVLLAGLPQYREEAEGCGLDFHPLAEVEAQISSLEKGAGRAERGGAVRTGIQRAAAKRGISQQVNRSAWQACQEADVIIYRIGGFLIGDSIAEKMRLPCFKVGLVPYTRTGQLPSLYFYPKASMGKWGNLISHTVGEQIIWQFLRGPTNSFRQQELGLKPFPIGGPDPSHWTRKLPVLYAFSPTMIKRPVDWPAHIHITGHWDLLASNGWHPPQDLVQFLQAGPAPVYIGFGSMAVQGADGKYALVLNALRMSGQRAVLSGVRDGSNARDENHGWIHHIDYAPHEWLFPQTSCVVHHGGVGTTTAQLKAGKPGVIVPFNYDQPFWAGVVARSGASPPPIPYKRLTAERLAGAILKCLGSEGMRKKAAMIGEQIRAERGVERAIEIIHRNLDSLPKYD